MDPIRNQETPSFSNIRKSVRRSLSTRVHQLRRRISSTSADPSAEPTPNPGPNSSLCIYCNRLDFRQVAQALRTTGSVYNPNGIIIGELQDDPATTNCSLCQVLFQACKETCSGPPLQLRAFYLSPHLRQDIFKEHLGSDIFVAAVSSQFSMVRDADKAIFDDMVSKRGFLMYHDDNNQEGHILKPHPVTTYFDPCIVQKWLRFCSLRHNGCRNMAQRPQSALKLINCQSQTVLKAAEICTTPAALEYVALSYVWGHSFDVSKVVLDGSRLPQPLPAVIRDAMEVVLKLGYQYLWVDKYCIDKHDKGAMMNMDSVYNNAALTIAAAAGTDESYGLPGVSKARPVRQLMFKGDGEPYTLISTLPLPHSSITKSRWATRGWTFQEAILSRRRLVFTDDQLYFECTSTSCAEGFDIPYDCSLFGSATTHDNFVRPSIFSLKQLTPISFNTEESRLNNFFTYIHCAEQYSKRTLTFDSDSLIAFSGIIRMLESIATFPVRNIWGIPFFHPDDDILPDGQLWTAYQTFQLPPFWKSPVPVDLSVPKTPSPDPGVDYLAYLMLGLCWRHPPLVNPRRRRDLPSWSWTGWEGSVVWPKLNKNSDIRNSTWANTTISLGSNSSESVPELYHKSTDTHLLTQSNKSLYIRTSFISPKHFIEDVLSCSLLLSTGGAVKLYASKNDLDASKVFKRIQSKRYEVIKLATVDEDTYMMLIKRYRNAYYRIGTMAVKDIYLTRSLFASKIKTYKLR
ncbi:heterokaryon incompatibility protein-domain-containing protein [Nemania abortiva]|nr:heterokaryon incompatibility protein-domain-containing protein [Nemania abortiva]